jgi:uncharacterized protein (DUF1810 family)
MLDLVANIFFRRTRALRGDDKHLMALSSTIFEETEDRVSDTVNLGKEGFGDNGDSKTLT